MGCKRGKVSRKDRTGRRIPSPRTSIYKSTADLKSAKYEDIAEGGQGRCLGDVCVWAQAQTVIGDKEGRAGRGKMRGGGARMFPFQRTSSKGEPSQKTSKDKTTTGNGIKARDKPSSLLERD